MTIHTCEGMHHRFVVGPGEPVVCPHCELVTLRAQVADKDCAVAMLAAQTRAKLELLGKVMELEAQLADCRAVLRERGHEIWCGSNNCGHLYAGGFCGIGRDGHGPNGAAHEFVARHGCTCGYARVMGEG